MYKIIFKIKGGEDVSIFAVGGENVLELAQKANVPLDAPCAGSGTCGKCKINVLEGTVEGLQLACQTVVNSDFVVQIQSETGDGYFSSSAEAKGSLVFYSCVL